MKNWKHFTFLGIFAILAFAIAFTACDNGNNGTETFTVTFDADNGSPNTAQTVIEGGKTTKPADPTKTGYSFVHWFNTATGTEWNFDTVITANIALKAKWAGVCEHDAAEYYHISDADCEDPNCSILPQNIFYGELVMESGAKIQIFRAAGVTDEQTATAIENIQAGHDEMVTLQRMNFETNPPSRIVVIAEPAYTWNNETRILGVRHSASVPAIRSRLNNAANGTLAETEDQPVYAQAQVKSDIRLAVARPANRLSVAPQADNTWERG